MNQQTITAQLKFNCSANWDDMDSAVGGKNCHLCHKKVYDFTNSNQDEFDLVLIENNHNICGRFNHEQLLHSTKILPFWKKWASAAIVLLGFNLFNGKTIAQNVKVLINKNNINYTPLPKDFLGEVVMLTYDTLPQFPGGVEALNAFLEKHISFKDDKEITYVQFKIDTLGTVKNFKVLQGAKPITPEETAEIVKQSPQWSPAILRGKPVQIDYTLQVDFSKISTR